MINLSYLYVWPVLVISVFAGLSMASVFSVWLLLELNMVMFLYSIVLESSYFSSQSAFKYFIVQALASMSALWGFIFMGLFHTNSLGLNILVLSILFKLGASPFHTWYIQVVQSLSWENIFLLSTLQKIMPLFLLSLFFKPNLTIFGALATLLVSSLSILSQMHMKRVLALSSLFNMAWMILSCLHLYAFYFYFFFYSAIFLMGTLWMKHFNLVICYSSVLVGVPTVDKMYFLLVFASMGGLPPFLLFWGKLLTIQVLNTLSLFGVSLAFLGFSIPVLYAYVGLMSGMLSLSRGASLFPGLNPFPWSGLLLASAFPMIFLVL